MIRPDLIVLSCLIGAAAGVGSFAFIYARGASYLTNNSAACANCHVMNDQYAGWLKSSHRAVAQCNDCHTPPGLVSKYASKATNGFFHSWAFTTGWFHEPIQIKERNRAVTEQACRHCHADLFASSESHITRASLGELSCLKCHRNVGHRH